MPRTVTESSGDRPYWVDMANAVRWWAQEVYADPDHVCVGGSGLARRDRALTDFVMHVPRLAAAAPDAAGVNTAQSFLSRTYVPLMGAAWRAQNGYGNVDIPLAQMKHHVSGQVHAARRWAEDHAYPAGRIGFGWARPQEPAELAAPGELESLAERLARSIRYAYDEGGGDPAGACSPTGEDVWCHCNVGGARWSDVWEAFGRW